MFHEFEARKNRHTIKYNNSETGMKFMKKQSIAEKNRFDDREITI